jgi:hypothetical protein
MGNSAPAKSSLIRERLKELTSAECLKIAERKMGEAVGDRKHGKELRATLMPGWFSPRGLHRPTRLKR